jgi:hypothetical protein
MDEIQPYRALSNVLPACTQSEMILKITGAWLRPVKFSISTSEFSTTFGTKEA